MGSSQSEPGVQVEARIKGRIADVFAWKVVDHPPGWYWGWDEYESSETPAAVAFSERILSAGARFADIEILKSSTVITMGDALTIVAQAVTQAGHAADHGIAIAKAATFLRFMLPRYVLVRDTETGEQAPTQDRLAADLADAERRAAAAWAEVDRKRRSEEWYQAHGKGRPIPRVRTWNASDDWREQD